MTVSPHPSRFVDVPGGPVHVVTDGEGPLVVLIHGFPETWYCWRHQIPALVAAGYRVAALDLRGYGRSTPAPTPDDCSMPQLVSDVVGVVDAFGAGQPAVVIGHDWGSNVASHTALARPDLVRALGLLSIPYASRNHTVPTENFAAVGPAGFRFYIDFFQTPGLAEAEIEADPRGWLRGLYAAVSAGTSAPAAFLVPDGSRMCDQFPAATPEWLTDDVLDHGVDALRTAGVRSALNRYRSIDRDWELTAEWTGAAIDCPALFVAGDQDLSAQWMQDAIDAFPQSLPRVETHAIEDCGHWIQQEKPAELNELLLGWLSSLPR
ncbi:alpha/beta fold hydrolase [Streptomyces yaizuensis]|uniref:Alpha/beta hydrolase n=1 Tax=Streptomyces yaizuensis TaxID=2989713 RepID=A0ABQ5P945_9ACTN|nr:alpha/beta hydrolase [Streptomyces sp. YSPA8]GLF99104.1 alpha/beta hydrolase [Streptomyces sp. YSPA8]